MSPKAPDESRDGVKLTNLDASLFEGADATKRDLVDYLDAVRDRIIPVLANRPLSVIRVMRGQDSFMQKNVPKYTPDFVETVTWWAETSKRDVRYAVCNDRRTLLWFANQRAVEYHPALVTVARPDRDQPPRARPRSAGGLRLRARRRGRAPRASGPRRRRARGRTQDQWRQRRAHLRADRRGRTSRGLRCRAARTIAARTERLDPSLATTAFIKDDREGKVFVDSTRVGGATVVAAYSPRVRPGAPVSFPLGWDELDAVKPSDFTVHSAPDALGDRDPWIEHMPAPQHLTDDLIGEGHEIPVARVQAMHEGKRRKRARGD